MLRERSQFRILFRDCLTRLVDVELLSSGGNTGKLLAQFTAILAAFSFTFVVAMVGKYVSSARPAHELIAAAQSETEFLFATTMAVAGMLALLVWNTVLPDARDCAILAVLPIRQRTIFLARVAAIGAVIGTGVLAINIFTGLCYPFLILPQGASAGSGLRSLIAYWLTMSAMGLFVCCTLLAVQGLSALVLSRRLFLRLSIWIQLAAFFAILGTYFLKPSLAFPFDSSNLRVWWVPSFWFYALFEQWNGTAPPVMMPFAVRALWCLGAAVGTAAIAFALAFHRTLRRVPEQPDITSTELSRLTSRFGSWIVHRVFEKPLDHAILLFTARTLARSRQHRLLLAAFGGIGMAITLVYAKDLLYGYSGGIFDSLGINGEASRYWNQANVPFLVGSLVLLAFAIIGVRATFSLPLHLGANWIFRIAAVDGPASYFSAVRKALYAFSAVPVWIAAAVFFIVWPAQPALEHVAILVAVGVLLTEISLYRFRKIPFTCSFLPGKTNMNVRLGVYAFLFLIAADRGVAVEYWALDHALAFLVLLAVLATAARWARRRASDFANARGYSIQFEDLPPVEVFSLNLRQEADPHPGTAAAQPFVRSEERFNSPVIGLNLGSTPAQASIQEPPLPFRIRFEQLLLDFRAGARTLRQAPAFSAMTILLIALGLGANLTIYSIIHSVLTKPAPGVRAEGLVILGASLDSELAPGGPLNSYPNYLDLAARTKTMSALTASTAARAITLTLSDGTYAVDGELIGSNYFQTLGVPLVRGRYFTDQESLGSAGLAAVIDYPVWQNYFQAAENVIGQRVLVNGHTATIVGVTAAGFHGVGLVPHFEIGLPLLAFSRLQGTEPRLFDRTWRGVTIIGRLAPHASLSQAKAEFAVLSERLRASHPDENRGWAAVLAPYSMTAFGPDSSPQARILMTAVTFIGFLALLVACANVASLLLGRSVARASDIAVRLSLGATGLRILRMLFAEGLWLSCAACCAAWPLMFLVTREIGKLLPRLAPRVPMQLDLAPDWRVFAYGAALAILATLAFALAPALAYWRQILPSLQAGGRSVVPRGSRLMNSLVIGQVALCALLVITGSLAYQSLFYINTSDLYFEKDDLLLASITSTGAVTRSRQNAELLERIRQRLRALPGVAYASYATAAPPHDHGWMDLPVVAGGSNRPTLADGTVVGPDYIHALGVPSLIGRDISTADLADGPGAAVINRKLAEELWPGESALGRTILLFEQRQPARIVGVVPNGAFSGVSRSGAFGGMGKGTRPNFVFLAEQQSSSAPGEKTFHIRYAGAPGRLIPEIRAAIRDVDGRVPVFSVRTMDEEFQEFIAPIRIVSILIGLFAASALLVASVGLYAAIAFHTAGRNREFGIRTALGATPWQVLRAVLQRGLVLTAAGTAIGVTIALSVAGNARDLLVGVDPTDKMTYAAVIALLAVVSLAACYLPARRASRIDPMAALRQD